MKKVGSSVDLVKIKLYFIKPIAVAENQVINEIQGKTSVTNELG